MTNSLFKEFLYLSSVLRPEYPYSLGMGNNELNTIEAFNSNIPRIYQVIYNTVTGTLRNIKNQSLMVFIPGYRLIHFDELEIEKKNLDNISNFQSQGYTIFPLITNYSSDFTCCSTTIDGKEKIYAILHDEQELILMHNSSEKFLETICEFYKEQVYFFDSDGYLDYDIEKEGKLGTVINPGIEYWM